MLSMLGFWHALNGFKSIPLTLKVETLGQAWLAC